MTNYITKERALQAVRDAEPVVHCKDCKWIGPGNCCVGGLYSYQHYGCQLLKIGIADIESFYCAEGCRR